MTDTATTLCQGYLTKTGPLHKPVLTWTRRWFVLEQIRTAVSTTSSSSSRPRFLLTYYGDETKAIRKGSVPIQQFLYINTDVKKRGKKNLFSIVTQPRTYLVAADDKSQMDMWLAKLSEALGCERVYHVSPLMGDKWRRRDALVRFHDDGLELICPNKKESLAKWQFASIRAMGSSGPMFWIDVCPRCAQEEEIHGLVFLAVERGVDTCLEMLRDARITAQRTASDPIAEKTIDINCTLNMTSHSNCSSNGVVPPEVVIPDRAPAEFIRSHSAVPASRPQPMLRGYSSPAFRATSERLSPPLLPENKHAAMVARFRSKSNASSMSALHHHQASANAPMVRVQYDHSTALGSPTRLHSVHRERISRMGNHSRYSSRSHYSEDSGLGGSHHDSFLQDDGVSARASNYVFPNSFPEEACGLGDESDNYGYEIMGPVNEEIVSNSSSESGASSGRDSYVPPLPNGNGYVNFEVIDQY
eukprot:m.41929 g.41929  ORF g.41929 m.41929 type:complete len:473 (+) comp33301_c0_seq3:3221-4639(+)